MSLAAAALAVAELTSTELLLEMPPLGPWLSALISYAAWHGGGAGARSIAQARRAVRGCSSTTAPLRVRGRIAVILGSSRPANCPKCIRNLQSAIWLGSTTAVSLHVLFGLPVLLHAHSPSTCRFPASPPPSSSSPPLSLALLPLAQYTFYDGPPFATGLPH
jgi:hypothetical protein